MNRLLETLVDVIEVKSLGEVATNQIRTDFYHILGIGFLLNEKAQLKINTRRQTLFIQTYL